MAIPSTGSNYPSPLEFPTDTKGDNNITSPKYTEYQKVEGVTHKANCSGFYLIDGDNIIFWCTGSLKGQVQSILSVWVEMNSDDSLSFSYQDFKKAGKEIRKP